LVLTRSDDSTVNSLAEEVRSSVPLADPFRFRSNGVFLGNSEKCFEAAERTHSDRFEVVTGGDYAEFSLSGRKEKVLLPPDMLIEEVEFLAGDAFGQDVEIDPEEAFVCPGLKFDRELIPGVVPLCKASMPLITLDVCGEFRYLRFDSESRISEVKAAVCPEERISRVHLRDREGELRDTDTIGKRRAIRVAVSDGEQPQAAVSSCRSIKVRLGSDEKSFEFDERDTVADARAFAWEAFGLESRFDMVTSGKSLVDGESLPAVGETVTIQCETFALLPGNRQPQPLDVGDGRITVGEVKKLLGKELEDVDVLVSGKFLPDEAVLELPLASPIVVCEEGGTEAEPFAEGVEFVFRLADNDTYRLRSRAPGWSVREAKAALRVHRKGKEVSILLRNYCPEDDEMLDILVPQGEPELTAIEWEQGAVLTRDDRNKIRKIMGEYEDVNIPRLFKQCGKQLDVLQATLAIRFPKNVT
jgi:hypothetical protein